MIMPCVLYFGQFRSWSNVFSNGHGLLHVVETRELRIDVLSDVFVSCAYQVYINMVLRTSDSTRDIPRKPLSLSAPFNWKPALNLKRTKRKKEKKNEKTIPENEKKVRPETPEGGKKRRPSRPLQQSLNQRRPINQPIQLQNQAFPLVTRSIFPTLNLNSL
jgi:hypothetical protein